MYCCFILIVDVNGYIFIPPMVIRDLLQMPREYALPKTTFRLEETVVDLWFVLQWRCALRRFVTVRMKKLCLNLAREDWGNLFPYSHSVETLLQFLKCRLTALSAMIECLTRVLISPSWETKEFWPGDIRCLQFFFVTLSKWIMYLILTGFCGTIWVICSILALICVCFVKGASS